MSSPSSPSRREFFKRAGTAVAAVAVVATPLSLFAQQPKVWKDDNGTLAIDGDNISLHNVAIGSKVHIRARGTVTMNACYIESNSGPAVTVESLGA